MKKLKPEIWKNAFKLNYEGYPFFSSVFQKGAISPRKKYFAPWNYYLSYFHDGQLYGFKSRPVLAREGNRAIHDMLNGSREFLKVFKRVHAEVRSAILICLEARENKEYANLKKWWLPTEKALSDTCQVIFTFDYVFDDYLKNLYQKSPNDFNALNSHIITSIPSFIDEANKYFLSLNKKYPSDFDKVYDIFMEEFGWFQNSYKGIFKINKNWLKKHLQEIRKDKKKRMDHKKLPLPKKFKLLAETGSIGITFRDDKKKLLLIAADLMENWLRNVCRKNGWKFEELRWLCMNEILELLNGKEIYLKKAKEYAAKKTRLGNITPNTYEPVSKSFWNKVYKLNSAKAGIYEIKGVIANKGIYKGAAKIITNLKKDSGKLKEGDVLVTSMTRPEYLPLMKKAGAFVTDEGGITSHASIVAREMDKPCIIGTKIATKILKDGDIVVIDANHGIIKIIKK